MGSTLTKQSSRDDTIQLVNISTNLTKSFSLSENIDIIIDEIFSYHKALISLEGLNHKVAIIKFYKQFHARNKIEDMRYYIVPSFDELDDTNNMLSVDSSNIVTSWDSETVDTNYKKFDKVIISSFPFENHAYYDLFNPQSMIHRDYVLIANIKIKNFVFSMFTCSLTDDLLYIDNTDIRTNQLKKLLDVIKQNSKSLKLENCKNILLGNFSISNIEGKEINNEYLKLVSDYPIIDLSSLLDIELSKKESYIMFIPNKKDSYLNKKIDQLNLLLLKNDNIFVLSSDFVKLDNPITEIISIKLLLKTK